MQNAKIKKLIKQVGEAQKKFSKYTQEQVDAIFKAAALAANKARIELAIEAQKETNMGIVEDKIIKNHVAAEFIYNKYKDLQTVGVYEKDVAMGYEKIWEPMGIVAAIIPTTNPSSTAFFKTLISLKSRNGIIISPHPSARNVTIKAAKIVLDAAVAAGAPEGIIGWVEEGTIQDTTDLMAAADIILATGGPGLVKAAYSSGTPAIGVGAGNAPAIIDSSANIEHATSGIVQSNTFDNGVICATENSVIVLEDVYDQVVESFERKNGVVIKDKERLDKVRKAMFREGMFGVLNSKLVGQSAQKVAELAGIEIPKEARLILCEAESTDYEEALSHEKLSTYVSIYKAKDFDDAITKAQNLLKMGPGHTSSLWIDEGAEGEKVNQFKHNINTGRLLVNQPSSLGGVGDIFNFHLALSFTLGCGTWGGNSHSENIGPQHLLNTKTVAYRRENMQWFKLPERVYHKFGCLPIALGELKKAYNAKHAFIVTDPIINKLYGSRITDKLNEMGISYTLFEDVEANPTLSSSEKGAVKMREVNPDVIIAIGGGSAMDAAKLMWMMYEVEEKINFEDLALTFVDIEKRIVRFPQLGKKAKMVCIPTTAGTGSEVTPFSVITDDETHIKYPLADYALTPNMAIIDPELMLTIPKSVTNAPALDALTHVFEAYVSVLATDYTDPQCLKAIRTIFEFLPRAYHKGTTDIEARSKMADAAAMAGMAFANAFLGIVHSLSHKIGSYHNVIHGNANAILLPHIIRYNAACTLEGGKQGYFSQNKVDRAMERYAEIARYLGIKGSSDKELVDALILKVQALTKEVEMPISFKEYFEQYGLEISKEDFMNSLDKMSQDAFDDQCTGANPRYPLIDDIKQIYIDAYEGTPIKKFGK